MFATTIATLEREAEILNLIRMAKQHEWESLASCQEFDPMKNALVVCGLRCTDGRLNILLVRNPFELLDDDSVEYWELLDENESGNWLRYLPSGKWTSFANAAQGW
jgi:hypothetical protein